MKRILSILLALCLAIAGWSSFGCAGAKASNAEEGSTGIVNLLESEETSTTKAVTPKDRGVAYDLTGMSGSPDITAESATVIDARSGEVLYAKQADAIRYPASITKVMTTLIAIENSKMDDIVTFTEKAVNSIEPGSSTAGINAGAKLTMRDTLYALMLVSANEAGAAVAEHVSGSNEEFAKLMTKRAKELGCTNTNFRNPHGLPDEKHYTTAHDMGLIMKEALKHKSFRKFAGTITYTIENDTLTDKRIELWNHAKILRDSTEYYYKYAKGAKTGFTMAASNTLVSYAKKDGSELVCVILKDYGADQSYYDTRHLYEWAFEQVKTVKPLSKFDLKGAISSLENVKQRQKDQYLSLNPTFAKNYPVMVKKDFDASKITTKFNFKEDTEKGRLGTVEAKVGDEVILSLPVTYDKDSAEAKIITNEEAESDDLQVAKPVNKNSPLKKIIVFLIRLIIAAALILVIMQMIRRWQLERKRQARIKDRMYKRTSSTGSRKKSSGTGYKQSTRTRSGSSSSGSRSRDADSMRKRRHK